MKCRRSLDKTPGWFHYVVCRECRRHRAADQVVARAVRRMQSVPVSAATRQFTEQLTGTTSPSSPRRSIWMPVGIAGLGVAGVLAIYLLNRPETQSRPANPPLAQNQERPLPPRTPEPIRNVNPGEEKWSFTDPKSPPRGGSVAKQISNPPRPVSGREKVISVDDGDFLNPGRQGVAIAFNPKIAAPTYKLPAMRDDFAVPAPMLWAANGDPDSVASMSAAERSWYAQEAKIVDARLQKDVTLALKSASFDEVCKEIARQTGVEITAGRNVADDNATLFITARPAREVMREISRVFGFVWERTGEEGSYVYALKQETSAQMAEAKLRNEDVSTSIQELSKSIRKGNLQEGVERAAKSVFLGLSQTEMETLRSGRQLRLSTPEFIQSDGPLDPRLAKEILSNLGGLYLDGDIYMHHGDSKRSGVTPYNELPGAMASVALMMKVTEFGGASLDSEIAFNATAPDGTKNHGLAMPQELGDVPGPSQAPLDNAKDNVALKSEKSMKVAVDIEPIPTTPKKDQGVDPEPLRSGFVTELQGSYRTYPALQPPRPFMTSDDFWQAVHEKTGKDIVADSYSRLFKLKKYRGSLFEVLSNGADEMQYHWRLDEGFITGRSASFHWQRLNEVPKRYLIDWRAQREKTGMMPLRGVLAMSRLTDRQLDSFEVGKAIAHQWHLPEWGIPSRPHMSGPRDYVRPLCRMLAALPEDQLLKAEAGTLKVGEVPANLIRTLSYPFLANDVTLRVDYIPANQYYWRPMFIDGKDEVRTDLIIRSTPDDVTKEVRRRYPSYTKDETSLSDGLLTLLCNIGPNAGFDSPWMQLGDQRFYSGFIPGG